MKYPTWGIHTVLRGRVRFAVVAILVFSVISTLFLFTNTAHAIPTKMNFQGRLTDNGGNIKPNGTYNMKFRLYDASAAGTLKWSEDRLVSAGNGVTVTNGLFSVQLGSVTALTDQWFQSGALYLEVELPNVGTETSSSPTWGEIMSPRSQLATSAYAYNSETLDGLDSSEFAQYDINNTFSGTNVFSNTNAGAFAIQNGSGVNVLSVDTSAQRVMIGAGTATEKLDIIGNWKVRDAATATKGVRVRTSGLDLDFETGGDKIQFSTWSGADFTGTQYNQFRMNNDGNPMNFQRAIDLVNDTSRGADTALKITGSTSGGVSNQTADIFQLKATSTAVLMAVGASGATTLKNTTNSTGAFTVQDASGASLLSVDTTNKMTTLTAPANGTALKLVGGSSDATNVAVMGVYNSAGTRVGYLGDGFAGSTSMYLEADTGNSINMGINGGTTFNLDSSGDVQIGVQNGSMSGHALVVSNTSATPMAVRRNTQDGNMISFYRDSTLQGSISVSGTTIAYNAFTGSHYAWVDGQTPDRGTLMTMTGENQYVGERDNSEIVYGVKPTTIANDSAVLGSYLSLSEPSKPFDRATNQHQIMSVGNGDMWVAENDAGDIRPGDELVSSSVAGHAMKDPGVYLTSNVIARASEKVDWSKVTTKINGVKHVRITVLFGSYSRNNLNQVRGDTLNVKNLVVAGHLAGNADTRGRIKIPAGQTSVTHYFEHSYRSQPFVVASPEGQFAEYYVTANKNSLTIKLRAPSGGDQWFTYMVQE